MSNVGSWFLCMPILCFVLASVAKPEKVNLLPIGKNEQLEFTVVEGFAAVTYRANSAIGDAVSVSLQRAPIAFSGFDDEGVSFIRLDPSTRASTLRDLRSNPLVSLLGFPILVKNQDLTCPIILSENVLVQLIPSANESLLSDLARRYGFSIKSKLPGDKRFIVSPDNFDAPHLSFQLNQVHEVLFAHPDCLLDQKPCEDPLVSLQWHLQNRGQLGGLIGADIKAIQAWTISSGSRDTIVAVLDPSGVQWNHPDLIRNYAVNGREIPGNGRDDDGNGYVDDVYGWDFRTNTGDPSPKSPVYEHGTACAGLIAAENGNGLGVSGVAPNCSIVGVRTANSTSAIADAFYYVANRGISVISISFVFEMGTPNFQGLRNAITYASRNGRSGLGCVVVCCLSNENVDNFRVPGQIVTHPDVIAVGRSTNCDCWGRSGYGQGMHLLAPSNAQSSSATSICGFPNQNPMFGSLDICTLDLVGEAGTNDGSPKYCLCNQGLMEVRDDRFTRCFGGTSASAPIVAGVAALVLSVNPNLNRSEVIDILIRTADKIDPNIAEYSYNTNGLLYSAKCGFGRVNAARAVDLARGNSSCTYYSNCLPPNNYPHAFNSHPRFGCNIFQRLRARRASR